MDKSPNNTDVLIIGGGIAGLALAAILGQAGIRIHIVDPFPPAPLKDTKPSGRTIALMQGSLNIIRASGVWDKISSHATAMETMRIIDDSAPGQKTLEVEFPASDIGLKEFGFNVPNSVLRAALFDKLHTIKNVMLDMPNALETYEVQDGVITASLKDGKTIHARLIVGADGKKSRVREIAGIGADTHDYGQSAVTCVINHSRSHNNTSTEFHRPGGPFALVPLQGNQSSVVWVERSERAEELKRLKKDEFIQTLQDATNNILGGVTLESGPECWPLSSLKAKSLTAPRMALMAEAAHVMSPITAQGLNLSLRDVAALAETIADSLRLGLDIGSKAVLDKYEKRRRIDINTRVFGIDRLNKIVSTDLLPLKDLRRTGLKAVEKIEPLRKLAMQQGLSPHMDEGRLARGEAL